MLPLESFACVFLIQLQFVRGFHYFPYRECQKHLLGFVRYNCKLQVSKLRTITLPLGQKTSRLGALFSFLAKYRQISKGKKGGFSFKTSYKQLETGLLGEGVAIIMSTGCSFRSSFKYCRQN
jgi:hypothetical protein